MVITFPCISVSRPLVIKKTSFIVRNAILGFITNVIISIIKIINIAKNINIPNFSFEFSPTESTVGRTLLYIANHLAYQNRNCNDVVLEIYLDHKFQ